MQGGASAEPVGSPPSYGGETVKSGGVRSTHIARLSISVRPQAACGGPARSDSAVWGRSVQRSQGIACRPMRHRSRCLRPSKHRRGRSARKAAPAPKPVGAARSGRSLIDGVQPVSTLPGKQGFALEQRRSRGTPLQLLRSEVASVWCGRDHCGSGAIGSGKRFGPASGPVENVRSPTEHLSRDLNRLPEP